MKAQEEFNVRKNEVEALNIKLATLNEEDLEQVSGGDESQYESDELGYVSFSESPSTLR